MDAKRTAVNTATKKLNEHFNKLMEKSDLYQAYLIGFGNGLFALYEHIAETESVEYADKAFVFALKDDTEYYQYFREAVEIFKKETADNENTISGLRT